MSKLLQVQSKLRAPKNQHNAFGGYKYRSCEDILEAVKPLLAEAGATVTITDDIIPVANRVYVMAKAEFTAGDERHTVTAYAREPESKKGMDESQVTGAASSYARKYALNGLFLIDDTRDADATNDHGKSEDKREVPKQPAPSAPETPAGPKPRTVAQAKTIAEVAELIGLSDKDRDRYIAEWIPNRGKVLTMLEAKTVIEQLRELQKRLGGSR